MKNKKFKLLILAVKLYLIVAISFSLIEGVFGVVSGWESVSTNPSKTDRKLSHSREQIAVIPLKDTIIYEGADYSITGVKSFSIQQRNDVSHSYAFYLIDFIKLVLGITALVYVIKFLRKSFALLYQFEKFIIVQKSNLVLLNKAAYNLLIAGLSMNLFIMINTLYTKTWFHLNGYRIDYFTDFYFGPIITALILLIISWIIKFAIELKEENDLTI